MFKTVKRISYALLGGITPTPNLREQRIQDALDQIKPGRGLEASRADVYRPGSQVSIESEAATTHALQRELDDGVEAENRFDDTEAHSRRGQPPCIRSRKEG